MVEYRIKGFSGPLFVSTKVGSYLGDYIKREADGVTVWFRRPDGRYGHDLIGNLIIWGADQ